MRASILLLLGAWLALSPVALAQGPGHPGARPDANVLEEDIRDIKGPVEIPAPGSPTPWLPVALGAALLGGAGFAAIRVARRARKLTALGAARVSFAEARSLIADGRARELAFRVSETVREFIERQLELPASRETTEEFLRRLGDHALQGGEGTRAAFGAFLEACDLAKFSGWQLDSDQMAGLLESGSNLVETIGKESAP